MQGPVSDTPFNSMQNTANEDHRPQVEQEVGLGQTDIMTGDISGALNRIQGQALDDSDGGNLVKLPICGPKAELWIAPMEIQEILLDTMASAEAPREGCSILKTTTGNGNRGPEVELSRHRPHKGRCIHEMSLGGKFTKVMQLLGQTFTFIFAWMMTMVWTARATVGAWVRNKTSGIGIPRCRPGVEEELGGSTWGSEGTKTFHVGRNLQSSWKAFTNLQINHIVLKDSHGNFIEDLTDRSPQPPPVPDESLSFVDQLTKTLDKPSTLTEEEGERLKSFLISREKAFRDVPGCSDLEVHRINTGNHAPIYRSPYQETPAKQKIIQEEVNNMLQLGLIEPSYSPWSSPVTLVRKSDGTCRFCIDYRALNKITLSDQFPMAGMVRQLEGAKYLSSVDMTMGYYQCLVAEEDREKTAFTCSAGLFQFRVMPFGLKTAPSTFNRLMAKVLGPVRGQGALAYLDDILIYSPTFEQHLQDIAHVFDLLQEANLFIKLKKCQFCRADFKFLGSILREGRILVDPGKTESVQMFKRPTGLKEVQRFLGLTGWLRRHVRDYALISRPLSKLTAGKNPKKEFRWTNECELAFEALKKALVEPGTALYLPDYGKHFTIECDASDNGIGGILRQEGLEGQIQIIEYASRILKEEEVHYTISEKECLAVIFCIKKFRAYIADRPFTVITDHSSLRWLLKTKELSGRLTRWSLRLQEFDYEIMYRKGSDNVIADGLSRGTTLDHQEADSDSERGSPPKQRLQIAPVEIRMNLTKLQPEEVRVEQRQEPWIAEIVKRIESKQREEQGITHYKKYHLFNDLLYHENKKEKGAFRLVLPRKLIMTVLDEFHSAPTGGHFGREKTTRKIKDRLFWHRMDEDIRMFVQDCPVCQLTKHPNKRLKPPLQPIEVSSPMALWALDLMGPYPISNRQNRFMLVIIDHYTKWTEIFPLRNSGAKAIAGHLAETMGRYGTPDRLLSDNGPQFISEIYDTVCKIWGVKAIRTTFYHPNSNPTERRNKTIKRLIRSYVDDNQREWDRYIPQFLLALRTTVNTTTGFTPGRLFLGRELNLPWDSVHQLNVGTPPTDISEFIRQQQEKAEEIKTKLQDNLEKHRREQKRQYDQGTRLRSFAPGDCVKVKNFTQSNAGKRFNASLAKQWRGPCFVKDKLSDVAYIIMDDKGKDIGKWNIIHIDKYHEKEEDTYPLLVREPDPLSIPHSHSYNTRANKSLTSETDTS